MLKTSKSTKSKIRSDESGVGVGGNSRAGCDGSELDRSKIDDGEVDGGKARDNEVGKKVKKSSKSKNLAKF